MKPTKTLLMLLVLVSAAFAAADTAGLAQSEPIYFPVLNVTLVNQSPDPVMAGGVVTLRISVKNTGAQDADDVFVGLDYAYPFEPVPGEPTNKTIESLPKYPGDYSSTTFELKALVAPNATAGSYSLGILRGVTTHMASWEAEADKISVRVTGEEFADVSLDTTTLVPGVETPIAFTVTNTGNAPLQDLVFAWTEGEGVILPVSSDNTRQIKRLGVGESIALDYMAVADVDTSAGLYEVDVSLEYDVLDASGDYATKSLSRTIGMLVGGETDFDVTFSESSEGQTSLSVANIGNNPALAVTVKVPDQDNYVVDGSPASIVGNLDSGDYTIVSFQITQTSFAAAQDTTPTGFPSPGAFGGNRTRPLTDSQAAANELLVTIEYTDTTGQRHSVEKHVEIQYRSATTGAITMRQQSTSVLDYWWVAALLAVLVAAIYLRRKGKLKMPAIPFLKK